MFWEVIQRRQVFAWFVDDATGTVATSRRRLHAGDLLLPAPEGGDVYWLADGWRAHVDAAAVLDPDARFVLAWCRARSVDEVAERLREPREQVLSRAEHFLRMGLQLPART